jgi:uncharacterized protein
VGNEQFLMGNVFDGITRPEISEDFKEVNVYSKKECSECFARFYCSGGCAANSFNFTGGINDVYRIGCEMQRKRVECAVMIKAALAGDEEISLPVPASSQENCGEDCGEEECRS